MATATALITTHLRGKVDCLCTVEPQVEATMVGCCVQHHKLPWLLLRLQDSEAQANQAQWLF
jgi:hypothetical protein